MTFQHALITGCLLGITAGISPGPLLMLVVSETVKFGPREGIKVALAPLITDSPIILLTFLILRNFSEMDMFLGILSLVGACYLLLLGLENLRARPLSLSHEASVPSSLSRGILANLLNPNPYIFWASVGTPILLRALQVDVFTFLAFLAGFYFFIVCSKIAMAFAVGRIKDLLQSTAYVYTLRFLGAVLIVFSCAFALDAYRYMGF